VPQAAPQPEREYVVLVRCNIENSLTGRPVHYTRQHLLRANSPEAAARVALSNSSVADLVRGVSAEVAEWAQAVEYKATARYSSAPFDERRATQAVLLYEEASNGQ
jgi:hypothetical protein